MNHVAKKKKSSNVRCKLYRVTCAHVFVNLDKNPYLDRGLFAYRASNLDETYSDSLILHLLPSIILDLCA
jgi:hypothetical protein